MQTKLPLKLTIRPVLTAFGKLGPAKVEHDRCPSDHETVHGKSSEAEVGPAQERKTFLNRYKVQTNVPIFLPNTSSMVGT